MGAAASIGTRSLNLPAPDSLGQWPASQTTYGTGDFGGQKTSGSIDPDAINKQFRSKAEADAGAFLGNLMKTGVGGVMEELGIGDWLPDFTQTPLIRSIAGGLEAFKGPLQGALEGKLGIQQPGWQPGMPVKALTEGGGDTTSGGGGGLPLFGLPNIELPPPPEGTAASGVGTGPPPGPVQNIDMSINYNDSTIGEDRVFAMPFSCVRRLCAACAADDGVIAMSTTGGPGGRLGREHRRELGPVRHIVQRRGLIKDR